MRSASWGQKLAFVLLAGALSAYAQDASPSKSEPKNDAAKPEPAKPGTDTSAAKPMPAPAKGSVANDNDYVIGTEDVLFINVWRENEMSRSVPVRPDGKISLPLVGEFEAAGSTPRQLQAKIAKQLETIITSPEVTVMVLEMRSQKITIMGEVGKPGSYPLQKPMSVLEGLALAGGPKDYAKLKKIYVLRRNADGSTSRMPFNYKAALNGDARQNFDLEARDTIVVP